MLYRHKCTPSTCAHTPQLYLKVEMKAGHEGEWSDLNSWEQEVAGA
jgi:hypothetical protein